MKVKSTRGFGKVKNPLTGDDIDVQEPFETDRKTFEALQDRYPGFVAVEPKGSEAENGEDQDANEESDADEGRDYASMDYAELRQLAADADTDVVNGKSSKDEIAAHFESKD